MKSASSHPEVLPVFPLTGTLLLPGTLLPLNVFEERYRNLVADSLSEGAVFGMIQPISPGLDNFGPIDDPDDPPTLQRVGCLGAIDRSELQADGRYHVVLRGVQRFRMVEEAEGVRGYRRVTAEYDEFAEDLEESDLYRDSMRVLAALRAYSARHGLEFDLQALEELSGVMLVNALSSALPFSPLEKQALLEARDIVHREETLLALMGMVPDDPPTGLDRFVPPTVH